MRTICDVCEGAPAILFCAADEAALCRSCDDKVHMCNKLASRHVRVSLANPSAVTRCDICENGPAFFYCEIDGSSLCLQCDMAVHVGGKRSHARYLLSRQRVEFPGGKINPFDGQSLQPSEPSEHKRGQNQMAQTAIAGAGPKERMQNNHWVSTFPAVEANADHNEKPELKMIDLNARPHRGRGQASNSGQKV